MYEKFTSVQEKRSTRADMNSIKQGPDNLTDIQQSQVRFDCSILLYL